MSGFIKRIQHILELIIICTFFLLFLLLPIKAASKLGGLIGRLIGFLLIRRNKVAIININIAFPDKSDTEKHQIILNMWDNLGRILGEMPHWYFMSKTAILRMIEIEGEIPNDRPLILLTGHYGNWELISQFLPSIGLYSASIYKSLNNQYIDFLLKLIRSAKGATLFTKNSGLKQAIRRLHQGGCFGMLIDQRFDNGIKIPFFNQTSQTMDLPARLAVENKIPIYMIKMMRLKSIKYKAEFIKIKESQDSKQIMCEVNNTLENWIKERPEQWFWIHRRWDKNLYK
jgi:KDO2-lipid IV(A) lauroyltransferase